MFGVSSIVPNTNIDGNDPTTVWNKQDKRALARCGMQMSISADGEKKGDSSASFDVRPDLFVW